MEDRHLCKAKRIDIGEWVEGVPFEIESKSVMLIKDDENLLRVHYLEENMWSAEIYAVEVDASTICQCTGLTDKNGKLIWENDIVKHYNNSNLPEQYDIGVIQWDDIQLRFKRTSTMSEECVCINSSCVYEVIGNIFDNPGLLEAQNE